MNKTLRFLLLLLLLPAMVAAVLLETRLQLPKGWNALAQFGIVAGICWLAWRWVIFDEKNNWREARKLEQALPHYRNAAVVEDVELAQPEPAGLPRNGKVMGSAKRRTPLLEKIAIPVSPMRFVHALMSVCIVFALTVVMRLIGSKTLGEGVIAILYLLPIGWCTVRWGQIAGVSAALTAALSFDFLFIPPYNTFNIGSPEGWLLLILFFATAILVVGRIQTILTEERERERKATFLFEMVAAIANQATREGIARAIANQIQQTYLVEGVQVHLSGGWGYKTITARAANGQSSVPDGKPDRALPVVSGKEVIGEIDIWQGRNPLPSEDDLMLQTMLGQVTAALDRVRVSEGKPFYPKQKPTYPEGDTLQGSHS